MQGHSLGEWVERYEPQREMIVYVTMQQPDGVFGYRLRLDLPAAEAVAQSRFYTSLPDRQ